MLSWDASEFRKQASQVESSKDRPSKEQLSALRGYLNLSADAHQAMREISMTQQKSIVVVILEATDPQLATTLTETQHSQCLAWLSAQLSARDREEITSVMCKSSPDFLTAAVRGAVDTYDPFIRSIHEGLDLRDHITALEKFLGDFIETSKPKKAKPENSYLFRRSGKSKAQDARPPSVEDFVALLRRNKSFLYNYCHQFAKNCVNVREQFRGWAKATTTQFRTEQDPTRKDGARAIDEEMQDFYSQLPASTRTAVLASLNAHVVYLDKVNDISNERMQRVLDQLARQNVEDIDGSGGSRAGSGVSTPRTSAPPTPRTSTGEPSMSGPGVFLMRWESLMTETRITPATPQGPVRTGIDVKGQKASGKTVAEGVKSDVDQTALLKEENKTVPEAPDVTVIMDAFGDQFRELVNARIGDIGPVMNETSVAGESILDKHESGKGDIAMGVSSIALGE